MFFLEKENRGYITPQAFNEYSNMAQLEIFEGLFFDYNSWVNKQNRRLSGNEYADLPKNIQEVIDIFAMYTTPSNFTYNETDNLWNFTQDVTDHYRDENLSLVNAQRKKVDIELANKAELNRLNNSNVIAPTFTYPIYEKIAKSYRIYPTLTIGYTAELFYIRTPKAPKWTFTNVQGNPIYNASAIDKQDFELPQSQYGKLVTKILLYCGINLREEEIVQVANNEEMKTAQKQNQI